MKSDWIQVIGAREHNLKNINVKIPKNKLVAITGPSGSGKSSFAMDILQRECQRQYMESMGLVTDGLNKPDVDKIIGLSPSIGISQRRIGSNSHSTVGTYTEILTYLRILYAKIGIRQCANCLKLIGPVFDEAGVVEIDKNTVTCSSCKETLPALTMGHFTFNKPEGACDHCSGLGSITEIDMAKIVNEDLTVAEGANSLMNAEQFGPYYAEVLQKCAAYYGFEFDTSKKVKDFNDLEKLVFYHGVDSQAFKELFPSIKPPKRVNDGYFKGVTTFMKEKAVENSRKQKKNSKITDAFHTVICPVCNGTRLGQIGRTVKVNNLTLPEICTYDMKTLNKWLDQLKLNERAEKIVQTLLVDLKNRIANLEKIGLGYLSLERPVNTLSGGEAQRLKLANIIDSGLTGVLYILDEPTTGLHPHDTYKLLDALKHIRDLGNTVLVIEHDMDFVKACDYVIDFGPASGEGGGQVIAIGHPDSIGQIENSLTGWYLKEGLSLRHHQNSFKQMIRVRNAYANNLKHIDVEIPVNAFVAFTGVSGSGKSSLLLNVIETYMKKGSSACDVIEGLEAIDRVMTVDQKAIGRMSRSNVATYTELYTMIRTLYAAQKTSKIAKLKAAHFSFNVKGGRCEHCQGMGAIQLDMQFLDDIEVVCPSCEGHRFKQEVLSIQYKEKNISQVLNMTVDACMELFKDHKDIYNRLNNLREVGLGYLKLGQSTATLSGGECQRIKLSKELGRPTQEKTLYILDEPTTGLHPSDTKKIVDLLYRLKDKGHTIYVIEHSLEVISSAEYIVDLGPNGGSEGGQLLCQGSPQEVTAYENSHTSRYLRQSTDKEKR